MALAASTLDLIRWRDRPVPRYLEASEDGVLAVLNREHALVHARPRPPRPAAPERPDVDHPALCVVPSVFFLFVVGEEGARIHNKAPPLGVRCCKPVQATPTQASRKQPNEAYLRVERDVLQAL